MGKIVSGGRNHSLSGSSRSGHEDDRPAHLRRGLRMCTRIEGKKLDLEIYNRSKVAVTLADVTTIQEHFGLNVSEALQLAVHLVAKGIKEGRFNA